MQKGHQIYSKFRTYRGYNLNQLINIIMWNKALKFRAKLQQNTLLQRIVRRRIDEFREQSITCRGLGTIAQPQQFNFAIKGCSRIWQYVAQRSDQRSDLQSRLDGNVERMIARSKLGGGVSVQLQDLLDVELLQKWNLTLQLGRRIWEEGAKEGKLSYVGLFQALQRIYLPVTEEWIDQYIRDVLKIQGQLNEMAMPKVDFEMRYKGYFLYNDTALNNNFIVKLQMPLTIAQKQKMINFVRRLNKLLDNSELIVLENIEFQLANQEILRQLQSKYNKQKVKVIQKLNLNENKHLLKIQQQIDIISKMEAHYGFYLSDSYQLETPEKLSNLQRIFKLIKEGQLIIESRDHQILSEIILFLKKNESSMKLGLVSRQGIDNHINDYFKNDLPVYSLVGPVKSELDEQWQLLREEMRFRILG